MKCDRCQKSNKDELIFEDTKFAHHYDRIKKREVSERIRDKILKQIKDNL